MRPDYSQARNNLGRVRLEQRQVDEALKQFREAVRLDPQNPQAWFNLSEAYAAKQDWSQAIDALERAARLPLTPALAAEIRAKRELYVRSKGPR
jgi:cytochrome c-type biogenesis protein CcmH/NrfG